MPKSQTSGQREKHTPGPWTCEEREVVAQKPGQPFPITICYAAEVNIYTDGWGGTSESNARLIAASPTLLEACEKFCAKIANAGEGVRFSEEARELVMSSVDDFQDAIALATKTNGGGM